MTIDVATMVLGALVAGAFSALLTVAALKVDVRWVKRAMVHLEKRVERVEKKVFQQ